ncbi:MAG: hypothetical protein A4E62_01349 [Syntrophorhabdus sp. PtaU1.Bin002]|nr:MAG: hypothetical protein A4E58_01979 [Syntrophorhabdus sp. PtaB.Bin006]OPY71311.1 MAG: hypothetical protein A4E62_01349 [Syntrophorhabdus sp. PtaU1.Bin002]
MDRQLGFTGELATTAMGIMPHEDIDDALRLALTTDIPFWPQLPRLSYYEDMYVQAMEHFPGTVIDEERLRIFVDSNRFVEEISEYLEKEGDEGYFRLSDRFAQAYQRFLAAELGSYKSIRGQIISPVSLALKIVDENGRPIVYNDEVRAFAYAYIQKKLNIQYEELKEKNGNAFVWIDDPGLEFIFNALCGYDNVKAKRELTEFFEGVTGPRGLHLCGRPDWDFLLTLNIEILSFNAYAFGDLFVTYDKVKDFLERGNLISWGIVPTSFDEFMGENVEGIAKRIEAMWDVLDEKGLDRQLVVRQSLLAPATCNLVNPDRTATVERSFALLGEVSDYLKGKYLQ